MCSHENLTVQSGKPTRTGGVGQRRSLRSLASACSWIVQCGTGLSATRQSDFEGVSGGGGGIRMCMHTNMLACLHARVYV